MGNAQTVSKVEGMNRLDTARKIYHMLNDDTSSEASTTHSNDTVEPTAEARVLASHLATISSHMDGLSSNNSNLVFEAALAVLESERFGWVETVVGAQTEFVMDEIPFLVWEKILMENNYSDNVRCDVVVPVILEFLGKNNIDFFCKLLKIPSEKSASLEFPSQEKSLNKSSENRTITFFVYNRLYNHFAHFSSGHRVLSKKEILEFFKYLCNYANCTFTEPQITEKYASCPYEKVAEIFEKWISSRTEKVGILPISKNLIPRIHAARAPSHISELCDKHKIRTAILLREQPVKDESQRCEKCKFVHKSPNWFFCKDENCMRWNSRLPEPCAEQLTKSREERKEKGIEDVPNKLNLVIDYGKRDGSSGWLSDNAPLEFDAFPPTWKLQDVRSVLEQRNNKSIYIVEWVNYGSGQIGKIYENGDVMHVERKEFMKTD